MFTSRVQHPRRSRADCQVDVYDMNERVAGDLTSFLVLPKLSLLLQLERYMNVIFNSSDFMDQTLSAQINQAFNFQYNAFMLMRR